LQGIYSSKNLDCVLGVSLNKPHAVVDMGIGHITQYKALDSLHTWLSDRGRKRYSESCLNFFAHPVLLLLCHTEAQLLE